MKNFTKTDVVFLLFSIGMPISLFLWYCKSYDPVWMVMGYLYYYSIPFIYAVIYAFVMAHKRDIMAIFPISILLLSIFSLFFVGDIFERYEFVQNLPKREMLVKHVAQNIDKIEPHDYKLEEDFEDVSSNGRIYVVSTTPVLKVAFCLETAILDAGGRYIAFCSAGWSENTDFVTRIINDNWAVVNSKWIGYAW